MKLCPKCKTEKEDVEFNKRLGQLQPYCAECSRTSSQEHYRANTDVYKTRNRLRKIERQTFIRKLRTQLKCERCGENHPATLDFHHKDKNTKEGSIANLAGNRGFSVKRILEEIAKCEVLCSNCHRKEHFKD